MAAPPDRNDLYITEGKSGPSTKFRLPRRTRRATYVCWVLVIATVYLLVNSATRWVVPGAEYFEANQPLIDIRFPGLYTSLSQVVGISGSRKWNHNIIFVAGNLTAASTLAGLACEMAQYRKNTVHMAFMGFDTLHLDAFRRINGLPGKDDLDGCRVYFHDARPEFAEHLTRHWQKVAVQSALRHINKFMHPQALIVAPRHEEEWFMDIVKEKSKELELVLIELPTDTTDDMNWIARLDSGSLNAWHKPSFEVVIHANTHSGNLERLLKSLQSAYYPSPEHRPKRITIVLNPHISIHPSTQDFLRHYQFPSQHKLSIRRPIISKQDPLTATVKFVESFYTLSDHHSVLFLDPNTELSKWYYRYLLFATLNYRYSSSQGPGTNSLFGISLEPPICYLDGRKPFLVEGFNNTPFLYPSPASRAALFFPQHWCEFHSYVSHKLWPNPNAGSVNGTYTVTMLKLADNFKDSWHSHFIELVRARGYTMLYPSLKETFAKVYSEVPPHSTAKESLEQRLMDGKFSELLHEKNLPHWNTLPLKDLWGGTVSKSVFEKNAMHFRRAITTCKDTTSSKVFEVDDLFCTEHDNTL